MWYEWVFDGIGTELVSLIIGLAVGGFAGYKICIKKHGLQIQIGKDKVKQKQVLTIETEESEKSENTIEENIHQVQIGKDHAQQTQIGKIRGGRN